MAQSNRQVGWDRNIELSNKAKHVNGNDDKELADFADALIAFPRKVGAVQQPLSAVIRDKLVMAERAYRQGRHQGISEEDVSLLFNRFATRLNLPVYAQTSVAQVRDLRMRLAMASPAFMGAGVADPSRNIGERVTSRMSPFQAYHLVGTLLDQKLLNENYQVPPDKWAAPRPDLGPRRAGKPAYSLQRANNPHGEEILEAIHRGVATLTMADAIQLVNDAFDAIDK